MGLIHPGVPPALVTHLQAAARVSDFVETGTAFGKSAAWASQRFTKVYTIERSEEMYAHAQKAYGQLANVSFLQGDSREHLRSIVSQLARPAIFWLDAHWSGGETYGEGDECPVLDEVAIIDAAGPDHLLLIDDARFFLAPPPHPHRAEQWPTIVQTVAALVRVVPDRAVVILDDVIVAVPRALAPSLTAFCQDVATARWAKSRAAGRRWAFLRKE